jgi:hypothetical protein
MPSVLPWAVLSALLWAMPSALPWAVVGGGSGLSTTTLVMGEGIEEVTTTRESTHERANEQPRAINARRPGEGNARRASLLVYSGLQGAFRFLTLAHLVGDGQCET